MHESTKPLTLIETREPSKLHAIRRFFPAVKFADGDLLFQQGDPTNGCYLIEEGQVAISTYRPNAGDVPMGMIGTGERARESSVVLSFERAKYAELAREKHPVAAKLLGAALNEILARLVRANRLLATTHVAASMGLLGG